MPLWYCKVLRLSLFVPLSREITGMKLVVAVTFLVKHTFTVGPNDSSEYFRIFTFGWIYHINQSNSYHNNNYRPYLWLQPLIISPQIIIIIIIIVIVTVIIVIVIAVLIIIIIISIVIINIMTKVFALTVVQDFVFICIFCQWTPRKLT